MADATFWRVLAVYAASDLSDCQCLEGARKHCCASASSVGSLEGQTCQSQPHKGLNVWSQAASGRSDWEKGAFVAAQKLRISLRPREALLWSSEARGQKISQCWTELETGLPRPGNLTASSLSRLSRFPQARYWSGKSLFHILRGSPPLPTEKYTPLCTWSHVFQSGAGSFHGIAWGRVLACHSGAHGWWSMSRARYQAPSALRSLSQRSPQGAHFGSPRLPFWVSSLLSFFEDTFCGGWFKGKRKGTRFVLGFP